MSDFSIDNVEAANCVVSGTVKRCAPCTASARVRLDGFSGAMTVSFRPPDGSSATTFPVADGSFADFNAPVAMLGVYRGDLVDTDGTTVLWTQYFIVGEGFDDLDIDPGDLPNEMNCD